VGGNDLSTTFSGVIQHGGFGGSLTKIGTGTLDLKGANTYTGQTNINGGVLQVDGSISSNTFINHIGTMADKGTLAGGGTVYGNVTNYGGEVSPGDPLGVPGLLTVSNYTQTRSASLVIQITGTDPDQVSVLNVLGNANLNGALDPELVNGFVPAIGQSFTFLAYASVTGSFSHIKNPVFDHGTKRRTLVYGPNSAYLVVVKNGRGQLRRSEGVTD
jgi:autotransporter-associated beta strand protein